MDIKPLLVILSFALPFAAQAADEELLLDENVLNKVRILRKEILSEMTPEEAVTFLKERMRGTRNNEEFLISMSSM